MNHELHLEIQREEKNVQKSIKDAAKRNDMKSAKVSQICNQNKRCYYKENITINKSSMNQLIVNC